MKMHLIGIVSSVVLLVSGVAYAQTLPASTSVTGQVVAPQTTGTTPTTVGVAQGLGVMLSAAQSVPAGRGADALALIALDATKSSDPIAVSSVPIQIVFNGVQQPGAFTNCALRNVSNLATPLNTGQGALATLHSSPATVTFVLDTPLVISAGSSAVLALTCDVAASAGNAGTVTLSIDPAGVPATNASTRGTIVPAADTLSSTGDPRRPQGP